MTTSSTATPVEEAPYPPVKYAWWVVFVLMLIYVFSFIDRQIMDLMAEDIKKDLNIGDNRMGLLMGPAFAIFYTLFGVPIGRLTDSRSRRGLIALGLIFWSIMTAYCGLANTFWLLFAGRIGVGIGEATLSPAAYSIITDYFPKKKLASAIGVYSAGIFIGGGLALILGGAISQMVAEKGIVYVPFLGERAAWQVVFLVVGPPGLLAALLLLTVREPIRRGAHGPATAAIPVHQYPLREVLAYMRANWRTLLAHNLGFAMLAMAGYGASKWIPAFFIRCHGWSKHEVGYAIGPIHLTAGLAGSVAGGYWADLLAKKGYRDSKMRMAIVAAAGWLPSGALFVLMPNATLAVILLIPTLFFSAMPFGVAPAALQEMMPPAMRGQASALYLFVINLIGLGLGPWAVGAMTEHLFGSPEKVRYSILTLCATCQIASMLLLYSGLKPFIVSMDRLKTWNAAGN